jgi:hypothetical protein
MLDVDQNAGATAQTAEVVRVGRADGCVWVLRFHEGNITLEKSNAQAAIMDISNAGEFAYGATTNTEGGMDRQGDMRALLAAASDAQVVALALLVSRACSAKPAPSVAGAPGRVVAGLQTPQGLRFQPHPGVAPEEDQ